MSAARRSFVALLGALALGAGGARPTPAPSPPAFEVLTPPEPSPAGDGDAAGATARTKSAPTAPDPVADALYKRAREAWRARTDVKYVRYGSLVRYEHNGHVFDNWWDAYFRPADGELALNRLTDFDEDRKRLGGVPFSIFGLTIFDTNRNSEPIHIDDPRIDPTFSFGLAPSFAHVAQGGLAPERTPEPASTGPREIAVVAANSRAYDVRYVGTARIGAVDAIHLTFTPLRDGRLDRLRELWMDPANDRTMQLRVQGILSGKPYDGVSWIAHYVVLDGRNYLQQIVADAPLHFGADTTIPKMEFDFFDYHFPPSVPPFTFGSKIF